MGDLATLHAQAVRLGRQINEGLARLEGAENGRTGDSDKLAADLRAQLVHLQRTSNELESVWRMHIIRDPSAKRDQWKHKVASVLDEVSSLKGSLDRFSSRQQKRNMESEMRDELFREAGRRAQVEVDRDAEAAASINSSKRAINEMLETGGHILAGMGATRERLKAAQRKVMDVMSSTDMGMTLLRLIERRQRMDIWMTYGGMIFILLFTGLLLWWAWF